MDGQPVAEPDAWQHWFWLWHLFFALDYAFTVWLILTRDEGLPAERLVSVGTLTAIAVIYAFFMRAALEGRHEVAFSVAVLVLLGVAILADSVAGFALFAGCPILSMAAPTSVRRLLAALAVLLPPVAVLLRSGIGDPSLRILLPMTAILVLFSICVGTWFGRVLRQSQERAELIGQLEASRAQVAKLSREAGISAERERLAREIHDTLAQGFTSIVALLQAVESELDSDPAAARRHFDLAARTARENLAEARAMVATLTPSALATGTLEEAVRRQAAQLSEETGITVTCRIPEPLPALPTVTEVVLLRATQEALSNIRKHAKAGHVSLDLSARNSSVRLVIADDGGGFDPARPAPGFGLDGMRKRARQVGGAMSVRTGPGTTVTVQVPV
ncbi:MAG TPA: sensor histidine kinase [Amycolatopsis sp.]|uniref:sensor histidine kinase n=1 Tax=Amycolatopsis sp. TaxID=37632 RepID=UPI002B4A8FD1|nr:sensor histidine kinase [Amycolatopsis sp.]HKS45208.1 sensor histidine kinase [Amycolatopsis sp.]